MSQSSSIPRVLQPLGKPSSYVVPAHEDGAITIPSTKSTVRIFASAKETEGLISVFGMGGAIAEPQSFHNRNLAHDVFMCTKGHLKVWTRNRCKIFGPGDFCYVPSKVDFFPFVTERYDGVVADEFDNRTPEDTFKPKFRETEEKYDVMFQLEFQDAEVSEWTMEDTVLPEDAGEEYYLKANTGPCRLLERVLRQPFITTKQSKAQKGNFAIMSIRSSNRLADSVPSKPFASEKIHQVYHMLAGAISVTVHRSANLMRAGETAFVPAEISIDFVNRYNRFWAYSSGDALESLIADAGGKYEGTMVQDQSRAFDKEALKQAEKHNCKISL
ncbi:hypothetical protein N0V86_003473 [Didymella sp. IMI 355093]|nr:hypothetical protein N0V86_003473 [Didymella sp. IMI 355093]